MGKMREKIRDWFTDSVSWLSMGQLAYSVYKLSKSYPGISDEGKLKTWLLTALSTGGDVTQLTQTEVDDKIIETAVQIVKDEEGWSFVYDLLIRAGSLKDLPETWNEPESAATIIAAIGLLVQLISKIREKRQNNEVAEMAKAQDKIKRRKTALMSADGLRSLGDRTQDGTKKNAELLFERIYGRPMSNKNVLGAKCGNRLVAECQNLVIASLIYSQKEHGLPVIEGRTNYEHDETLKKAVKKIYDKYYIDFFGLTKNIMQTDVKQGGINE